MDKSLPSIYIFSKLSLYDWSAIIKWKVLWWKKYFNFMYIYWSLWRFIM